MQLSAFKFGIANHDLQMPQVLYGLFLAAIIIDVGGSFGLKYLSFALIVSYLSAKFLIYKSIKIPFSFFVIEGGLFFIFPLIFLILAITVFFVTPSAALGEITPFAIWLLYPLLLLIHPKEKIISFFTNALFFGALLIVAIFCTIYLLHLSGQDEFIKYIYIFTYKYNLGYFGARPFEDTHSLFFPNVYPRWTLLLIPASVLLIRDDVKKFIIVALATFLTISTAAIVFMICGLFWAAFGGTLFGKIHKIYVKRFINIVFIILISTTVLYFSGNMYIVEHIVSKLGESPSTLVKIGHITSILNAISADPITLFVGMGVGSSFWSTGTSNYVSNVEVSHFNLIRQFGLVYSTIFFLYVIILFSKLYQLKDESGKLLAIGLMTLFVAAGTNPLLISPIFFLVMVISRAYITLTVKERREVRCLGKG